MAATITTLDSAQLGTKEVKLIQITGDTSYPTGGYSMTPASIGLQNIIAVFPADSDHNYLYNLATKKVQFFRCITAGSAFAETASTTNVSTSSAILLVIGTGN